MLNDVAIVIEGSYMSEGFGIGYLFGDCGPFVLIKEFTEKEAKRDRELLADSFASTKLIPLRFERIKEAAKAWEDNIETRIERLRKNTEEQIKATEFFIEHTPSETILKLRDNALAEYISNKGN